MDVHHAHAPYMSLSAEDYLTLVTNHSSIVNWDRSLFGLATSFAGGASVASKWSRTLRAIPRPPFSESALARASEPKLSSALPLPSEEVSPPRPAFAADSGSSSSPKMDPE